MFSYLVPGPVNGLKTIPLGSSAILVEWNKPEQENGKITGYKICYRPKTQREGHECNNSFMVTDSNVTKVKLALLKPSTTYTIFLKATTNTSVGESYVHIF